MDAGMYAHMYTYIIQAHITEHSNTHVRAVSYVI